MTTSMTLKVDEIQVTAEFAKLHGWAKFQDGGSAYMILAMPPTAVLPRAGQEVVVSVSVERRIQDDPHYTGIERRMNKRMDEIDQIVNRVIANRACEDLDTRVPGVAND